MSRTDNTQPFLWQVADPANPGVIDHNHIQEFAYYVKVPVAWSDLVATMKKYGYYERLIFVAFFGTTRQAPWLDFVPDSRELEWAKKFIDGHFTERVAVDRGDELTGNTVVGFKNEYRRIWANVDCDYVPYSVADSRCSRWPINFGGRNYNGGHSRRLHKEISRKDRRQARRLLDAARYMDPSDIVEPLPTVKRTDERYRIYR